MFCPGCDYHGFARKIAAVGLYQKSVFGFFDGKYFLHFKLGALGHCLVNQFFGKLISRYFGKARNVFHFGRKSNLSAERLFFDDQHAFAGTQRIYGGGKSCRTSADNYYVVHYIINLSVF